MRLLLPALFALFWSLQSSADQNPLEISAKNLSDIVKVMASDHFEGRAPGTPGEDKTVAYLIAQMQKIGLEPGGANGSWTQAVPMMRSEVKSPVTMTFSTPETVLTLDQGISVSLDTATALTNISAADVPVVFVGFGANAPEQDWDDYGHSVHCFRVSDTMVVCSTQVFQPGMLGTNTRVVKPR